MLGLGRTKSDSEAKIPFSARFKAWWEGEDPPAPEPKPAAPQPLTKPIEKQIVIKGWTGDRIDLVQQIFGEGMTGPYSEDFLKKMIDPLGLNEKMTVVEIGASLGGFARYMAKHTGAYVTAFEMDELLAKRGADLSIKHGLAKKAAVVHAPNGEYEVRQRTVDAVLSKEALYTIPNKKTLFGAVRKSLKPGAQLLFTDYVLEGDPMNPEALVWQAHEPITPQMMTASEYRNELESHGLEVRVFEDVTQEYLAAAMQSFAAFAELLKTVTPEDERRRLGLLEAELWNRRARVLRSGLIKVYRIYARLSGVAK